MKFTVKLASMLLVLMQFTVLAQAQENDLYKQLLVASGGADIFDDLPAQIKAGLNQGAQADPNADPAKIKALLGTVDTHLKPATINQTVINVLKEKLTVDQVKTLLKWYNSELGKEIVAAEDAGATEEAMMAIQQQAQQLFADKFRVGLAQRMEQSMQITDKVLEMQVGMAMAVATGMTSMGPSADMPDMATMRQAIEANMEPMRGNLQSMMILMMVYSYKNVSEDKLTQYEAFINTPESKIFTNGLLDGMKIGVEAAVGDWAKAVAKVAGAKS